VYKIYAIMISEIHTLRNVIIICLINERFICIFIMLFRTNAI